MSNTCVDIAPEHGDAKEKTVNRALVPDRRVERMVVGDKPKGKWNTRLADAVEMARQAGWEDLDLRNLCVQVLERRRKHTKDFNMQAGL